LEEFLALAEITATMPRPYHLNLDKDELKYLQHTSWDHIMTLRAIDKEMKEAENFT
jgi:hypothetical protein